MQRFINWEYSQAHKSMCCPSRQRIWLTHFHEILLLLSVILFHYMNQMAQIWRISLCRIVLFTYFNSAGSHGRRAPFQVCEAPIALPELIPHKKTHWRPVPQDSTLTLLVGGKHSPITPRSDLVRPLARLCAEPCLLAQMVQLEGGRHHGAAHPCCHVKPDFLLCLDRDTHGLFVKGSPSLKQKAPMSGTRRWEYQPISRHWQVTGLWVTPCASSHRFCISHNAGKNIASGFSFDSHAAANAPPAKSGDVIWDKNGDIQ